MLARRGKFFVAEPFFGPGPRLVVSRDRRVAVGDLIVVRAGPGRNGRAGGRATIAWRLGRSDVAHDVIEGLMVERGLRVALDRYSIVFSSARSGSRNRCGAALRSHAARFQSVQWLSISR